MLLAGGAVAGSARGQEMSARKTHRDRYQATGGGRPRHRGVHGWHRILGAISALLLLAVIVVPLIPPDSDGTRAAARSRGGTPASAVVIVDPHARRLAVPRSFLGISTEYWALPRYERRMRVFERVLSQLRARGDGPFVLRVGGESADYTFWEPTMRRQPRWVFGVTPRWLSRTRVLVRQTGVRLIIDLNLLTDSTFTAARWVRAAYRALPRGSVAGFEIGNEPDIYSRFYWLAIVSRGGFGARILPEQISAGQYAADFISYARMIGQVAPGVPLLGPALSNPLRDAHWLPSLIAGARSTLSVATAHLYPFSACAKPRSPVYPTIRRILSERASAGMASSVSGVVHVAHRARLPLRLTEINSVTCHGRAGVSDSFATALWAPDALFELLRAGVDGVNVHLHADATNAAFLLRGHGLRARPLLYGLIMFARTLGPGAQLVPLRLNAPRAPHLKAWAVQTRTALHVLLIDKGRRSTSVLLRIPGTAPARVERLSAPSERSPTGVTLAGQQLGADGRWRGPRDGQTIVPGGSGYRVTVPGISAALVRIPARRGT